LPNGRPREFDDPPHKKERHRNLVRKIRQSVGLSGQRFATDFDKCVEVRVAEGDTLGEAKIFCEPLRDVLCDGCGEVMRKIMMDSKGGVTHYCDACGAVDDQADVTPLERCVAARMASHGETEDQATQECEAWMEGRRIRGITSDVDVEHLLRESEKQYNFYRVVLKTDDPKVISDAMTEDRKFKCYVQEALDHVTKYGKLTRKQAMDLAAKRIAREKARDKAETAPKRVRLTVGSTYGKTKEQIIKEDQEHMEGGREQWDKRRKKIRYMEPERIVNRPPGGRPTVGSLYMKTRDQILREQREGDESYDQWSRYPEKKAAFDKCVRERMAKGMTREQAKALCAAATLPSDEPGPRAKRLKEGPI
jgi:hypothetical protein